MNEKDKALLEAKGCRVVESGEEVNVYCPEEVFEKEGITIPEMKLVSAKRIKPSLKERIMPKAKILLKFKKTKMEL